MLRKNPGSDETLVHDCTDGKGKPHVYLHDVIAYMVIDGEHVPIKNCPYCGTVVENDDIM